MGPWKQVDSPRLGIPLELREVTAPGTPSRVWEVQELRTGCVFKATLTPRSLHNALAAGTPLGRGLTETEIVRAVSLSIEHALASPPEKEPGETYEVSVSSEQVSEAALLSG